MKNIMNWQSFNEGWKKDNDDEIESIKDLLEGFVGLPEFIEMFGEENVDCEYETDSQDESDGSISVWVSIKVDASEFDEKINSDYDNVIKPFVNYCNEHDLYNPSVLGENGEYNLQVTIL